MQNFIKFKKNINVKFYYEEYEVSLFFLIGAFLIPYFTMMVIEGIPLFYLEFVVGQRFRQSAVGCWKKIHPALMGIGISCIITSFLLCIYYIVVIAWCFYYLFVSLTSKLPWRLENCPQ